MIGLDLAAIDGMLRRLNTDVKRVLRYPVAISTQDMAINAGKGGAPEVTVVLAAKQAGGRGRGGHRWFSPPGGLYASLVLRPNAPVERWPMLPMLAGLSITMVLRGFGLNAVLKWPNDVMAGGLKVAGCLAKALPEEGFVVLGIGVNILWDKATVIPEELKGKATTIHEQEAIGDLAAEEVGALILTGIIGEYMDRTDNLDLPVEMFNKGLDRESIYDFNGLRGRQLNILDNGALRISGPDGVTTIGTEYAAGD